MRRTYGEVHPVATLAVALYQQLIKVLPPIISRIEQYSGIPDRLLHAHTSDIHSAARQVVARMSPTHAPIDFRRSIPAANNDRLFVSPSYRRG